jgi:ABC-2 type transport system ATP-binding protein
VVIIETRDLCRGYGRRVGITAVDLNVREGQIFGFLGPNGAGKTTTIRVLLGLLRPTSGVATVFGLDCWHRSHRIKQEVGYLPGDLRLYPWLTGEAALRMVGRIRGRDLMPAGRRLADRYQLEMSVQAKAMSRGMRQKLGLILALAHKPRLLILDEPTSGLDPLMRDELSGHLRELAAEGHTVFFSSHTLSEVEQLCDHIAIVRAGRIAADESLPKSRGIY